MDRDRLRRKIHKLYREEHEALGEDGTLQLLEQGREWELAPVLEQGGCWSFRTQVSPTAAIRSRPSFTPVWTAAPIGFWR